MLCAIKKHQNVRSQKSERQVRGGHCLSLYSVDSLRALI